MRAQVRVRRWGNDRRPAWVVAVLSLFAVTIVATPAGAEAIPDCVGLRLTQSSDLAAAFEVDLSEAQSVGVATRYGGPGQAVPGPRVTVTATQPVVSYYEDFRFNLSLDSLPTGNSPDLTRNAEAKERFKNEARSASALEHPNVCTVHAIEETEDGQLFIAMALYRGSTLDRMIRQGRWTGMKLSM